MIWSGGIIIAALTAFLILFEKEVFRWRMAFRVKKPEHAVLSGWETVVRTAGWTLAEVLALVVWIRGLR